VRSDQEVVGNDAERKGWQRVTLNFNIACPREKDRKPDAETPPGDAGAASGPPAERPVPVTPHEPRGRTPTPAPAAGTEIPTAPGGASGGGPEGPSTVPGAVPGDPNPGPGRPQRIPEGGPPHVGGPSSSSSPMVRSPAVRTVERPVGPESTRRVPAIRPGN
jgi:hypothetical protein